MKKTIRHIFTVASLLLVTVGFTFCTKTDMRQWKVCYDFTAEELAGGYLPNPDDWESIIPEEVENTHAIKNASASITKTSDNTVIVNILGMPSNVDNTFSCTIQPNDFMFNSGTLSVKVFKNDDNNIRLSGHVKRQIGTLYDEALGDPIYHLVAIYEHYYFDVIKKQ